MKQAAFTLIELLVVIFILSLLGSLIITGFSNAKSVATRIKCSSHLRSLTFASISYCDENDQRLFPYLLGQKGNGIIYWFGWLEKGSEGNRRFDVSESPLWKYVNGKGMELCGAFDYDHSLYKPKSIGASFGFGFNLHLSSSGAGFPHFEDHPFRLSQIQKPSQTTIFADAAQINDFQFPARSDHPLIEEFYYVNDGSPFYANGHFRHSQRANSSFADGHIDTLKSAPNSLDPRLPSMQIARLPKQNLIP